MSSIVTALLLVALVASPGNVVAGSPAEHRRQKMVARRLDIVRSASMVLINNAGEASSSSAAANSPRVYHVTAYGADPTGRADSTEAINKAISDAFRPPSNRTLTAGIPDLGGAEVHLDGGTYLISSPISLPAAGGGNFKLCGGALMAADEFPADRYMIELSSPALPTYSYEYVTMRDIMLDANYRGGGIAIVDSLRITVDGCYIVHFATDGISVEGGHETFIRNSFVGQHMTAGNDPGEKNFSGTGIRLAGNDNAVTDVVVFSAATGILVTGEANVFTGVHCYNKATGFGGTGIYLKSLGGGGRTQTRIVGCYLDYTSIVAEDPVLLHVSSSFFLGDANVVLKSIAGMIRDVEIVGNMFSGSSHGTAIVELDELKAKFTSIGEVNVVQNVAEGMAVRSTVAKGMAAGNSSSWTIDLSPALLFPDRIMHVQYSMVVTAGFPKHAVRSTARNQVVIESDIAVDATIHVVADQSGGQTN